MPHHKFINFIPFDFKLSTILLWSILDQNPKKIKRANYFWCGHRLCNCGGMDKKMCFEEKFIFGSSPIISLSTTWLQTFHDTSFIYTWSESVKNHQNGGNFLMTSWHNDALTSWQVAIWKKNSPNWSYIIFRKS